MANDSVVTQNTLQTFYDNKVYPYLNGATHTGCVPLGTVLPYYGETAPEHFLICDGTEYLKSDYGELATHLLSLTDPTPYQGSDADHFKVPDLRGEFLRGSGTNSHTNQGSGSNVGVHQDATDFINMTVSNSGKNIYYGTTGDTNTEKYDTMHTSSKTGCTANGTYFSDRAKDKYYTSRPTNTSVTYIIAYQNAYIDLALDGFPIDITQPQDGQLLMYDATAGRWVNGGHKYSTDEHIVGTWINNKPIYEKTIDIAQLPNNNIVSYPTNISNIDIVVEIKGITKGSSNSFLPIPLANPNSVNDNIYINYQKDTNSIRIYTKVNYSNEGAYITMCYTKTTDTV